MRKIDATYAGIESACFETLCTRVMFIKIIKPGARKFAALSTVGEGGDIDIYLDLERVALIRGTFHELLHQVLDDHMEWCSPIVRERFIQSMEYKLVDRMSYSRLNEWRKAINDVLRKGLHDLP